MDTGTTQEGATEMMHFLWPWIFALLPLPWLLRMILPVATDNGEAALRVPYLKDFVLQTGSTKAKASASDFCDSHGGPGNRRLDRSELKYKK